MNKAQFDSIMTKLYLGYGKEIKQGQLDIMYTRLDYLSVESMRRLAHRWIDNEKFPPVVSDINKLTGQQKSVMEEHKESCASCKQEAEYTYTVGSGDNARQVCASCFYVLLDKQKGVKK